MYHVCYLIKLHGTVVKRYDFHEQIPRDAKYVGCSQHACFITKCKFQSISVNANFISFCLSLMLVDTSFQKFTKDCGL